MKLRRIPGLLALALTTTVACGAHTTVQTQTVTAHNTQAAEAIAAAQAVGAEQHPQPSLHLKLAKDQLEEAKRLIREDDDNRDEAVLLFERATADAELALLLTRQINASQNAQRAREQVENLARDN